MFVILDCINNFSVYLFKKRKKKKGKKEKNTNIIKQQRNIEQTDLAVSSIHIIFRDWRRGINDFGDCCFFGLVLVCFLGCFLFGFFGYFWMREERVEWSGVGGDPGHDSRRNLGKKIHNK